MDEILASIHLRIEAAVKRLTIRFVLATNLILQLIILQHFMPKDCNNFPICILMIMNHMLHPFAVEGKVCHKPSKLQLWGPERWLGLELDGPLDRCTTMGAPIYAHPSKPQ